MQRTYWEDPVNLRPVRQPRLSRWCLTFKGYLLTISVLPNQMAMPRRHLPLAHESEILRSTTRIRWYHKDVCRLVWLIGGIRRTYSVLIPEYVGIGGIRPAIYKSGVAVPVGRVRTDATRPR
jgi:hypothetical protein